MPTAETTWGHWGVPSPTPAWTGGPPKLHGETGGVLKPQFANTLKWYYRRAKNPQDKQKCVSLLAAYECHKEENKRSPQPQRPLTAQGVVRQHRQLKQTPPPKPDSIQQRVNCQNEQNTAYQRQAASINRLSRPRTARPATSTRQRISERAKEYKSCPRPKSAMADIGRRRATDPYTTTQELDFPGYPTGLFAEATRPMSSKGFTAPYNISDPVGETTCQDEFAWKTAPRIEPIRSGTSSGNRKNNPHPHESFMRWRLPNKTAEGMMTAPAKHLGYRDLSAKVMDQILKDQLKSTYQNDYLGIPQGYQVKDAIDAPADWRGQVSRPKHTTVRHSYIKPEQQRELAGNTSRYGCNKNKSVAALGAVPTVTKDHVRNQELIKGKTSYETEFRSKQSQPDLVKLLNQQSNQKVIDSFLRYSKVMDKGAESGIEQARSK